MKHFINIKDIPSKDLRKILDDAKKRKNRRKNLNTLDIDKDKPLSGKLLIQMFEKPSSRTRLSFYLAIKQLGGGTLTLKSKEIHLGKGGESLADTAKILSTYGDGFMLRTDSDKKVENFKKLSKSVVQEHPLDFPANVTNTEVTIIEVTTAMPISYQTLSRHLSDHMGLPYESVVVCHEGDPLQAEQDKLNAEKSDDAYDPIMGQDYKKEDTTVNSNILRSDVTNTFDIMVTKAIGDIFPAIDPNRSLFINMSYEKVRSEANILNYDYITDSFSLSFSKSFNLN